MTPLEAQVALNMLPGLGPILCRRLLDHFGSATEILQARPADWINIKGIGPELCGILKNWESHTDPVAEIEKCREEGIQLLTPQCKLYPSHLREIYDAPLILYYLGELRPSDHQAISVVGSRRCSHYGLQAARKLSYQLANCGQTIVSGLARGIDTAAHEAALAAGGRTIAILGSGLKHIYPAENIALADRIADGNGAVVSEYPLHTRPDKHTFPMRNRIVAGWTDATVVIECPDKSGALITANLAGDYGRGLFVLPGPVDRKSFIGSHHLIRSGATLITDAGEVLQDLGGIHLSTETEHTHQSLSPQQSAVLSHLTAMGCTADELIEATGLPAPVVSQSLALLEIQGLVASHPGSRYTPNNDYSGSRTT